MLVVMILMMLLKLLYDGISIFCSEIIVSVKNPYTTYRKLISENRNVNSDISMLQQTFEHGSPEVTLRYLGIATDGKKMCKMEVISNELAR